MKDDLGKDYEQAGFGGKLRFGRRPALLLIDIVMAYLDPQSHLYAGAEGVLDANVRLAQAFRACGAMVVFTRVTYQADGLDGGLFFRKVPALRAFLPDSPFAAFPDSLRPTASEIVVDKQYPSAFFGTSLASTLHASAIDTVVIGGFSTSGCVRATALDALQNGFAPFVVSDACGERDRRPHEANLFDIKAKIGEVVLEADIQVKLREAQLRTG